MVIVVVLLELGEFEVFFCGLNFYTFELGEIR